MNSQRGVALALLLWFIAALALLVSGVALLAKTDRRYVQQQLSQAEAEALGDGAAWLFLWEMQQPRDEATEGLALQVFVGNTPVWVRAVPASGLIDIYQASEQLLTWLFTVGAGLDLEESEILAQSVVQWRTPSESEASRKTFGFNRGQMSIEALLSAPGMTRDIFERIRYLLTVSGASSPDPAHAPMEVLAVLAEGNAQLLNQWLEDRQAQQGLILPVGEMRVDSRMVIRSGPYQRSVWMRPGDELPMQWQVVGKMPSTAVASVNFSEELYGDTD